MRAIETRHHHPLFRSGDSSEKSTREVRRPRRESHGVSVLENPEAHDRLDSWKEIAFYLKRTVRTVQRWEKHEGLPVHRHLHQRANSVYARKSEVDEWWNHDPRSPEIEPVLVPSEGSRRQGTNSQVFKLIHSEEECRESDPMLPEWLVECVRELQEAETGSPEDKASHVVIFRRLPIHIAVCLLELGLEKTTRDAKAPCRSLSLAPSWLPA